MCRDHAVIIEHVAVVFPELSSLDFFSHWTRQVRRDSCWRPTEFFFPEAEEAQADLGVTDGRSHNCTRI